MINSSKLVHEKIEGSPLETQEEKKIPPFKPLLEKEEKARDTKEESFFDLLASREKKKSEKEESEIGLSALPPPLLSPLLLASIEAPRFLAASLAPLFEAMVGQMQVMTEKGVVETTVTLNAPKYANSPFYGTQITIREYSTAPKIFNIEVSTSVQAAALLQKNQEQLLFAMQGQGYNFKINRFEASLLRAKDEEQASSDDQQQQGNERQ